MADSSELQPTVLQAAWRYRWLVLACAVIGVGLGIGASMASPNVQGFAATSSLILREPGSEGSTTSSRYLANQLEVMDSVLVAEEAARLIAEESPQLEIGAEDVLESVFVTGGINSDLVVVTSEGDSPESALAMVNGLVEAYQSISKLGATSTAQATVDRIDVQLAGLNSRLDSVQAEIERLEAEDVVSSALTEQTERARARIAELQALLPSATDEGREQIQSELDVLRSQLSLYALASSVNQLSPELQAAEQEESQLITRRADLLGLRDQTLIDLDTAPSPVLFAVPADEAEPIAPPGAARFAVGGLVLGLVAGSGIAYWLVSRRRVFGARPEPETILTAPLIAEIPSFSAVGVSSQLPVIDDPRSMLAEAYRFAASSLDLKAVNSGARTLMAVSAIIGSGKTTTVANTAAALAQQGHRVLVIDADMGSQSLARMLGGEDGPTHPGISEVLEAGLAIDLAVQDITLAKDVRISLMGRGRRPGTAADLLRQSSTEELFQAVREQFDLVIVDGPPLLQVAYASTLIRYVDAVLVVVRHKSAVGETEEVANRLGFLGTNALGYVYTDAPVRKDLPQSGGSLMDILGTQDRLR